MSEELEQYRDWIAREMRVFPLLSVADVQAELERHGTNVDDEAVDAFMQTIVVDDDESGGARRPSGAGRSPSRETPDSRRSPSSPGAPPASSRRERTSPRTTVRPEKARDLADSGTADEADSAPAAPETGKRQATGSKAAPEKSASATKDGAVGKKDGKEEGEGAEPATGEKSAEAGKPAAQPSESPDRPAPATPSAPARPGPQGGGDRKLSTGRELDPESEADLAAAASRLGADMDIQRRRKGGGGSGDSFVVQKVVRKRDASGKIISRPIPPKPKPKAKSPTAAAGSARVRPLPGPRPLRQEAEQQESAIDRGSMNSAARAAHELFESLTSGKSQKPIYDLSTLGESGDGDSGPGPAELTGPAKVLHDTLNPHKDWLAEEIEGNPGLTLERLRDRLAERGVQTGTSGLELFLKRSKIKVPRSVGRRVGGSGGTGRESSLAPHENWIRDRIRERPNVSIEELRDGLAELGTDVGAGAVWQFLKARGIEKKRASRPSRIDPHLDWLLGRIEGEPTVSLDTLRVELADRGANVGNPAISAYLKRRGIDKPVDRGGRKSSLLPHEDWIRERVSESPEITIGDLRGELSQRGVEIGSAAVEKFLKSRGIGSLLVGRKPRKSRIDPQRDWIVSEIEANPAISLEALREGLAERGVSVTGAAISTYLKRNGIEKAVERGGRQSKLVPHEAWIRERIEADPEITMGDIRAGLAERGVEISAVAVSKFLASRGLGSLRAGRKPRKSRLDLHKDWLLAEIEKDPGVSLATLGAGLAERGVSMTGTAISAYLKRNGIGKSSGRGGGRVSKLLGHEDWIRSRLAESPEITMGEMRVGLAERGVEIGPLAVAKFLKSRGIGPLKAGRAPRKLRLDPHKDWILSELERNPGISPGALGAGLEKRGVSVSGTTVSQYLRRIGVAVDRGRGRRWSKLDAHESWIRERVAERETISVQELCEGLAGQGIDVGAPTVTKFLKSRGIERRGGSRRSRLDPHLDWLKSRVGENPSVSTEELQAGLAERGETVSAMTVSKFLKQRGIERPRKQRASRFDPHRDWLVRQVENEPDIAITKLGQRLAAEFGVSVSGPGFAAYLKRNGIGNFSSRRGRESTLSPHEGWIRSQVAEAPDISIEELRQGLGRLGVEVTGQTVTNFLKSRGIERKARGRRSQLDPHRDWLRERIADSPSISFEELGRELEGRGVKIATAAISTYMKRHGIEKARGGGTRQSTLSPHEEWIRSQVAEAPSISIAELREGLERRGVSVTGQTVTNFLNSRKIERQGHGRKSQLDPHRDWLRARVAESPSVSAEELSQELSERGVDIKGAAVTTYLKRHGIWEGRSGGGRRSTLSPHEEWIRSQVAEAPSISIAELRDGLERRGVSVTGQTVTNFLNSRNIERQGRGRKSQLDPHRDWLRERVAESPSVSAEELSRELSERGVAIAEKAVASYMKLHGIGTHSRGGGRRSIIAPHEDWVRSRISENPAITLDELRVGLEEQGVTVTGQSVSNFLKSRGIERGGGPR